MRSEREVMTTSGTWIFRLLLLGLLAQLALSYPLWFRPVGVLNYLPVFSFISQFWINISIVLFPFFILAILLNLYIGPQRRLLVVLMATAGLLVLGNIHRLQVWFYFYLICFSIFLFITEKKMEVRIWLLRCVFIMIYCWSGIHKLNIHFANDIFPWILERTFLSEWAMNPRHALIAGLAELSIGIGLAMIWSRRIAVIALSIFHLGILYVLGPMGHHWNMVVWPWNVLMPVLGVLLFYSTPHYSFSQQLSFFINNATSWVMFFLVGLLPAFNYFKVTPEQLSFKMYAGTHPEIVFYYADADKSLFKNIKTIGDPIVTGTSSTHRIQLDDVTFAEFGTPLFITKRVAKKTGKSLCECLSRPDLGGILYLEVNAWEADFQMEDLPCDTLFY